MFFHPCPCLSYPHRLALFLPLSPFPPAFPHSLTTPPFSPLLTPLPTPFPPFPPSLPGCLCNLDRAQASIPYLRKAWQSVIPAVIALVFMYIGASWLLMHGAAQWARTRNEAKLMARIPGASVAQAAAEDAAAKAVQASAGTPPPAPMARV